MIIRLLHAIALRNTISSNIISLSTQYFNKKLYILYLFLSIDIKKHLKSCKSGLTG